MATATRIKGGPDLKIRLDAVANCGPDIQAEWAGIASQRISAGAPIRTGRLRSSIEPRQRGRTAAVYGAFWGIFIDRGTKAHDITPRRANVLAFPYHGQTVFAKKVHRRRMSRRPFITEGAQSALADTRLRDQIIQAWNRRRAQHSGFRKFSL